MQVLSVKQSWLVRMSPVESYPCHADSYRKQHCYIRSVCLQQNSSQESPTEHPLLKWLSHYTSKFYCLAMLCAFIRRDVVFLKARYLLYMTSSTIQTFQWSCIAFRPDILSRHRRCHGIELTEKTNRHSCIEIDHSLAHKTTNGMRHDSDCSPISSYIQNWKD